MEDDLPLRISAVPAGIYAKQALKNLQIWPKIKNKLAQSTNVRAALALVERDEVPLGIVYHTDPSPHHT